MFIRLVAVVVVVCPGSWLLAAEPASVADISAVVAAVEKADLKAGAPAKPRKVLVLTESSKDLETAQKSWGMKFVPHASAPHCAKAVALLGERTGAFAATVVTDTDSFTPEKLAAYDAVVLANVYLEGKLYRVPSRASDRDKEVLGAREKALIDFVRGGKGLAGVHNATAEALGLPEYQEMIGGTHAGHAWWAHQTVPIKLDDEKSPLNAAFGGKGFTITEDIYSFASPYSRDKLHVLLSVDAAKAPQSMTADRPDRDYPVSWIKPFGEGRVFYTLLGHSDATYANAAFLGHLLAGIQFAMGDLKADATPGKPLPADSKVAAMPGFQPLFDGKDLSAWQLSDAQKSHWLVENGLIRYDGRAATLKTKDSFQDYVLRVDFRLPCKADSGVFVRDNFQLNIWTWAMGSGEMWEHRGRAKTQEEKNQYIPKSREDRPVGEWNTFLVTVKNDNVTVELNGKEVISSAPLMSKGKQSPIGLQQHGDPLEYKNIYIKPLPAAEAK